MNQAPTSRRAAYVFASINFALMLVSIIVGFTGSKLLFIFAIGWAALGLLWLRRARQAPQ